MSHPVPTETQPGEWRRSPIGRMDGDGVCSCVVDAVTMVCPLQGTGAAADGRTEGLDQKTNEEGKLERTDKQSSGVQDLILLQKNDSLLL